MSLNHPHYGKLSVMAPERPNEQQLNRLYYGDSLDVLRQDIATECADLIYLDPPFSPSGIYNTPAGDSSSDSSHIRIKGFDNTWIWTGETESLYGQLLTRDEATELAGALKAIRRIVGEGDLLAHITMMAARLVEVHRVLKRTGWIFLHCDPIVSHYIRAIADTVFGNENFRNEIIWKRAQAKSPTARRLHSDHDVILAYAKSNEAVWNERALFQSHDVQNPDPETAARYPHRDADGRRYQLASLVSPKPDRPSLTYEFLGFTGVWRLTKERMQQLYDEGRIVKLPGRPPRIKRYLDEQGKRPLGDVWTDITTLNSRAAERLGYPTQKPIQLLSRIIEIASQPGSLVLDPFAGSGTTLDAAQRLGRRWVGIETSMLAIDLIDTRLRHIYSESIRQTYEILGIPRDLRYAEELYRRSPLEFERWCVTLVGGQPNDNQGDDRGIEGIIRIPGDRKGDSYRILVSVKGGSTYPDHVRDVIDMIESQHAAMGVLICLQPPTAAMQVIADNSGIYTYPVNAQQYPKVQIITISALLEGVRPNLPTPLLPYLQARPKYGNNSLQSPLV